MKQHLFAAALLLSAAGAAPALAATTGSAVFGTARSCAGVTAADLCNGGGPGQNIFASLYGGGIGVGGLTDFNLRDGSFARADIAFGALDLPEIRAETLAVGNVRTNINAFGFKAFEYTGAAPALFTLTGALHIVDSSTNATDGALPGGAIYSSYVAIWDPTILTGLLTPQDLFSALFYAPCGTAGVLGVFNGGGALPGGEATFTGTTTECSPGSLLLAPGQQVLAVAGVQLPVNRGGFADSTATFVTRLGDDLSVEQQLVLVNALVSGNSLVPEPASWAMLIAGFGLVGAVMRRRVALAA